MTIRTRFAPSPTGYLHIGGVRTALFNWLLAKRLGGQFVLRIDDTDAERNRPEALQPILDGFRWLGIPWDEGPEIGGPAGPYFQSQRDQFYRDAVVRLIESGHAYPDYSTKEQLAADRVNVPMEEFHKKNPAATPEQVKVEMAAIAEGKRPYAFRGAQRDQPAEQNLRLYRENATTVRLKIAEGQVLSIVDAIRGKVEWPTNQMADPVIMRGDGSPLYNFATVVDDVSMKMTHVIRAAEHLTNTAVQVAVYEALGAPVPTFAHVPVVNEPNSKKKLSKRTMKKFVTEEIRAKLRMVGWTDVEIDARDDLNPATVAFYREMGYLPAALVNYLGRLGWSLDDKTEVMSLETMVTNFGLERVNDSSASFDPEKLHWMAGEYMKQLPVEDRVRGVIPFLQRAKLLPAEVDPALHAKTTRVVEACGDRIKVFSDILHVAPFFFRDPIFDAGLVAKRLKKSGMPELVSEFLAATTAFDAASLEAAARAFCETKAIKIGDLNHALRVAATGVMTGPGMFEILAILGREETLRRVEMAMKG